MVVEPSNLVVSAVKSANDGSGDTILRLYENAGKYTEGKVYLKDSCQALISFVAENKGNALSCENEHVSVSLKPFDIQTVRIIRS